MASTKVAVSGMLAVVKDVLHAAHIPGGETLGALLEAEVEKRNKATFDLLLDELAKGRDGGVRFDESDAADFVQMVLRLFDATQKGAARRNLRLLAQVIVGLKRCRAFQFDRFQRWANVVESLTRDEILVLGTAYRVLRDGVETDFRWQEIRQRLVPRTFAEQHELEAVCAALLRTGLVTPVSAFGGLAYRFSDSTKELGELAELELSAVSD
jgi:hypothetical protein